LGLSIAGDVVRAHGGELRFRERSEDGFAVILRFKRLHESPVPIDGGEAS
jgi:two-component system, OmpR family, sensor histidine kinase TctE